MNTHWMRIARIGPLAAALAVGGCSTFSRDGGFDRVADTARTRLGHDLVDPSRVGDAELRRRSDALLAGPLSVDAAVQLSLLGRGMRATYRALGIAEADLVQAGRLPNPGLEFKHVRGGGGGTLIERTFLADLAALLTLPLTTRIERARFDEVQLQVADAMLKTAATARRAWVDAVAAAQREGYARQVVDASDAAADLAQRMRAAGNWSALAEARERAFHADALAELHRAVQVAVERRERLVRALGLEGTTVVLPARLPDLPDAPPALDDAERVALEQRLDLVADRVANRRLMQSLGLVQTTRFVNALQVGRDVDSGAEGRDGAGQRGYEIRIEVPLFDFGDARVARARAVAEQAIERTAQHAIDASSEVRERVAGYRSAWDLARHYRTVVLPLKQRISADNLLRYNGMLISVFELIADAREQTAAVVATLDAQRDFWIAEADLAEALGGALPETDAGRARPIPKEQP